MSITRTTVSLDSGLLGTVKDLAARQNRTLGEVFTEALQRHVSEATHQIPSRVILPTSGHGGLRPGVSLNSGAELSALLDEQDLSRWS